MKIAVMQPYFFPYIGYFSLIKESDVFVACDEVQYIKQGWINRNRIICLDKEFIYINIALKKASQNSIIREIEILDNEKWKNDIINKLQVYKKKAPYFEEIINVVKQCLTYNAQNIAEWNVNALRIICDYLGIYNNIKILSKLDLAYDKPKCADEWGCNVTEALVGDMYMNLPGGESFYDVKKYTSKGINIKFIKNNLREYDQKIDEFKTSLSIIDVLMFNSIKETNKLINDFEIM